jgi:hypothetical protein
LIDALKQRCYYFFDVKPDSDRTDNGRRFAGSSISSFRADLHRLGRGN